jgi:hypothetical protein
MDEKIKNILLIILLIGFGLYVVSTMPINISYTQPYPPSCGITEANRSESYTISVMCGLSPCPMTFYYRDLVCTNGTTILKYQR